jgi:hypothetical protein
MLPSLKMHTSPPVTLPPDTRTLWLAVKFTTLGKAGTDTELDAAVDTTLEDNLTWQPTVSHDVDDDDKTCNQPHRGPPATDMALDAEPTADREPPRVTFVHDAPYNSMRPDVDTIALPALVTIPTGP